MKLKEKIMSVSLAILPLSLIGMAFSYFMECYHAMSFWGFTLLSASIAFCALSDPHKASGMRKMG